MIENTQINSKSKRLSQFSFKWTIRSSCKRALKSWPKILCFILAIIPLIILGCIVAKLIINSLPVFQQPVMDLNADTLIDERDYVGLQGIFSNKISAVHMVNEAKFGLIPAIWGTVLVVAVAMGIAAPISLVMAIFSSEFTLGFMGRGMRTLLGVLAGIPYIIYALMWTVLYKIIILPNFRPDNMNPPEAMTWYHPAPYSTIMGGIMLSLLVIPFLAPLFDDAIRNVPSSYKEASVGLGATRWHTLWHVTLPAAFSGLLSALSLGIMKSMGEVIIVAAVIGVETNIPSPFFDIFQPVSPLTATGVGLAGGFGMTYRNPIGFAVANCAGLLLIIMAVLLLITVFILQSRLKKRFSRDGR